jgi:hypothetical protein
MMNNRTRYAREGEEKKCYRKSCPTCGKGRWVGYHGIITPTKNCRACCRMIKTAKKQKVKPPLKKGFSYKEVECSRCKKIYTVERKNLYYYMKNNHLKKYLCQKCKLAKVKEGAEEERKKEIEFLKTLTVAKESDPLMLNKNKKFKPRKTSYNGCAWQEEEFIGSMVSNSKRCKQWDICVKKEQCLNKLCKIGWKSFTTDCKGFVLKKEKK